MQNLRKIHLTVVLHTLWIMDHLGPYRSIYIKTKAAVTGLNNLKFYTIITEITFLLCLNLERDPTPESGSSGSN